MSQIFFFIIFSNKSLTWQIIKHLILKVKYRVCGMKVAFKCKKSRGGFHRYMEVSEKSTEAELWVAW